MLKAEVESRLIEGVKELQNDIVPSSIWQGLSHAANELRLHTLECEDVTSLRCIVGFMSSIAEGMYCIGRLNELVLEYERNMKGGQSC